MRALLPSPWGTGLAEKLFIWRIDWSTSWGTSASCGRKAEETAEASGSTNSTRAGDSSSASW